MPKDYFSSYEKLKGCYIFLYIVMSSGQNFEEIIDYKNRDYKDNSVYPPKSWFKKLTYDNYDRNSRNRKIKSVDKNILITHNDADGLVSGALFRDFYRDMTVVPIDYDDMEETFDKVSEYSEGIEKLFVADLNLDKVYSSIEKIAEDVDEFKWFDHHEWGREEQELEDMGIEVTIDRDKCGARIVFNYLKDQGYSYSSSVTEIVDLTEDHDLWIKNSTSINISGEEKLLSDIISTVAFFSDNEDFMNNILQYGKDFINNQDNMLKDYLNEEDFLEDKIKTDRKKRNYIKNNYTHITELEGYTVAIVYGRASPGKLLEDLKQEKGVQVLVLMRPKGKVSIRSDESFKHCHEIAENLGGGGHEQAAGAFPEYASDWGIGNYVHHWNQKGHSGLKRHIEDEVEKSLKKHSE